MTDSYDDRSLVGSYLDDIAFSKPLSREREVELAARIQEGDAEARDELVQANLLFVVRVARQFQHCGLPLSDLIGVGNWGLMVAAERFDGTKGTKFISYAVWWIRQSILQAIAEQPRTVRLPMNQIALMQRISFARAQLDFDPGRGAEEWAEELQVSVERVEDALLGEERICSLDQDLGGESQGRSLADFVADPDQTLPDAASERASEQVCWERMLSTLSNRERYVIRLYFGFEGGDPMTLEHIGSLLGVSRERVRQVKKEALAKLAHSSRSKDLRALVEE